MGEPRLPAAYLTQRLVEIEARLSELDASADPPPSLSERQLLVAEAGKLLNDLSTFTPAPPSVN